MTVIETNNPKIQYEDTFVLNQQVTFNFPYVNKEDIHCTINGEEIEYSVDYTVFENTITLKREFGYAALTIYRATPLDQQAEFPQNNRFDSAKLNESLDKICMQQQEQAEAINRAMKVPISTVDFNGTLPAPTGKEGHAVIIDETGKGLAFSDYDVHDLDDIANRIFDSIDNIDTVSESIDSVNTDAANIKIIDTVADSIVNVNHTGESITNVNIVGDDLALGVDSAINKVNANKENIDINAANIEDIQNAEENARTCIDKALEAATSANRANTNANNATIWAEGTDEQVETLGGQHSAKGWAEVASQGQIQSDWEQEDATKKDYIKNKPDLHTGYFPGVHVGLADNLYDASAPVDISSFWFRTSAGEESITTGPAALRALRGNMLNSGYTPRSGNYTASSGITVNNFDLDAFEANNPSTGTYVFQYNRPNWTLNGSTVNPNSWGLDVTPRPESLNIMVTGEITASCTDVSIFATAIGGETGSYTFVFVDYDDEITGTHVGPYWTYNGEEIDLIDYALSITGEPSTGNSIIINYTAPLLTGTVTVEYVKAVLGTLTPAAVDYLFATVSMNQYDKNGVGRLTHIINNATIDNTGEIVSGTGKVACVRAVGGIYSGYVAYSESQYITRIAHTPLVWNNGAAILPAIGDTLSLEDTTQDAELSVALFGPVSWVCVAVTDDSDLSIHPRWSSGQDQDHTYDEYSDNRVEIPKVDKNGVDLPTGLYGMPAIGNVFDEIRFETVNTYTKRIERVANTVANMAMVQAYGTPYLYDSDYIFYVLKDADIVTYELGDVSDDYIANDYGTEALVATIPDNMCTLNISYGTNLKDKLRTNVLTISQQDLTKNQQRQVQENIGTAELTDKMLGYQNISQGILENPLRVFANMIKNADNSGTIVIEAGSEFVVPYGKTDLGLQIGDTFLNANFIITDTDYNNGNYFVYVKNLAAIQQTSVIDVWGNGVHFVAINITQNSLLCRIGHQSGSSTTWQSSLFYNTDTNILSDTQYPDLILSFPVCRFYSQAGRLTLIQEIYHNIGFIGKMVWVRKGLKVALANGRNAKGNSAHDIQTLNKTVTFYYFEGDNRRGTIFIQNDPNNGLTLYGWGWSKTQNVNTQYHIPNNAVWSYRVIFSRAANRWYRHLDTRNGYEAVELPPTCKVMDVRCNADGIAEIELSDATIISSLALYNLSDLAKLSMPTVDDANNRWDIPLAATGATYIARYTGYIFAYAVNSTSCNLHHNTCRISATDFIGGATDRYAWIPISAGDIFSFYWNGTVREFKNIPAVGAINSPI